VEGQHGALLARQYARAQGNFFSSFTEPRSNNDEFYTGLKPFPSHRHVSINNQSCLNGTQRLGTNEFIFGLNSHAQGVSLNQMSQRTQKGIGTLLSDGCLAYGCKDKTYER
jgi:hypothetical protein